MNATLERATHAHETEADPRWTQVRNRDATADGSFVFAVRTTGVFCNPSCASRAPLPGNVAFFETPEVAVAAGFRACKRCRPGQSSLATEHALAVTVACRTMEAADMPPSLAELAASANMSAHHFHRVFKSVTGLTPKAYASAKRGERMRRELGGGSTVTEAIYEAGYGSNGRFYAEADGVLGMKPASYRAGGEGAAIRFAVGGCSLGVVLVAQSDAGVCAILLGDGAEALVTEIQDRFPNAELAGGDAAFEALVANVVGMLEGSVRLADDLPLDIRGTAFQQRVWQALRQVPPGETVSYADLARRIGSPSSSRAVAGACAANTLAVAIPCHRVVRNDGGLGGYRWGIERKAKLLEREGAGA